MAAKTYTVTVATGATYPSGSSGNVYYLDGVRPSDYNVTWPKGATLRFDQSNASNFNHPLIFSSTTSSSDILTSGVTYYLDGVSNQANYTNTTTFNAATTRYVEITYTGSADFYWLCYVHGIGMGGTFTLSNEGWSSLTWGFGKWGDLGNTTTSLNNTNLLATTTLGTGTQEGEINSGWGRADGWGTNGWNILGTLQVSGIAATANLSSVTIDAEINTGWGSDTWGTELWGSSGLTVPVTNTNLLITAAEGSGGISFDGDSNLTLTGLPLTATLNNVDAFAAFVATPSGFDLTMQLSYNPVVITPAALPMTMTQGTVNLDANTIVEVSAKSASTWNGNYSWGFGAYGNQQVNTLVMSMLENFSGTDPEPDVSLTGNAIAAALAQPGSNNFDIIGNANIPVTNVADNLSMAITTGNVNAEAVTQVDVTGIPLTATLNSVAEIIGTATVSPTGFGLTNSLGTATNVLIWNEVNTGTAPVDPPGWQEVNTNAA
jgi:hypothetical protein